MPSRSLHAVVFAAALVGTTVFVPGSNLLSRTRVEADVVFLGGKVLTVDDRFTIAQAIAVQNGRVLAVGTDAEVLRVAGPGTRRVPLGGRTVTPGFIDSHLHAVRAARRWRFEVRADMARTIDHVLAAIRERARTTPAGTWIVILGGWHYSQLAEARMPTRDELDRAAPRHPVHVQAAYDVSQMNTVAIQTVKIEPDAKLPEGVQLERDASGRFTGVARGFASMRYIETLLPQSTLAERAEGLRLLMSHLNSLGVTSLIEAGGGGVSAEDFHTAFELWRRGGMTARMSLRLHSDNHQEALPWITAAPFRFGDDMLRVIGLGEIVNVDVWRGVKYHTPEALADFARSVAGAADRGLSVQVDAVGDQAIENVLAVFERVNARTPVNPLRFSIIHGEFATDVQLDRMKRLGVGVGADSRAAAKSLAMHDDWLTGARDRVPLKRIAERALPLAIGTDGTIAGPLPTLLSLYWAISGRNLRGELVRPTERLSREAALRAVTHGAAWFSFDEDRKGVIAPGYLADFVVLDRDVLAVPENQIPSIRPVLTVMNGEVVFDAKVLAVRPPSENP